jgi:sugar O-acyltransferase (sialic acid O-acetyltransferase NeuD family)
MSTAPQRHLYLYGCGGHAKVILDILHRQSRRVTAILDDRSSVSDLYGVPVYRSADRLAEISPDRSEWIIAIGNNSVRQRVAEALALQGHLFTQAIHPSAQIALGVCIQPGTVVMANAVINADAQIGHHVIVNTAATIDHDCVIQDYCHIAPGCALCGAVQCGMGVFLGVGTKVCPGLDIGAYTTCGAGSVVVQSLPSRSLAYGCPARVARPLTASPDGALIR